MKPKVSKYLNKGTKKHYRQFAHKGATTSNALNR